MPRAPFLLLLLVSSPVAMAGPTKPLPPVIAEVLSPQPTELFPEDTEYVVLDSLLSPRPGHTLSEFLCRWTVDGEEVSFQPPDSYGHCGANWLAVGAPTGMHIARLSIFQVPPQPGSLAQLIVAHNRGFVVAAGPTIEGLTAELEEVDGSGHVVGTFRASDSLVYSTAPTSWLDVDITLGVSADPEAGTGTYGYDTYVVNPFLDGEADGWVYSDFDFDIGDPESVPGCAVNVTVTATEDELPPESEADGVRQVIAVPTSTALATSWEDASGRGGSLLWSSQDPTPGDVYASYPILATAWFPEAASSVQIYYENTSNPAEPGHIVSCNIETSAAPSVPCDVPAEAMGVGVWRGTPYLYDSSGSLMCVSPDTFDVELRPYDTVDNDGDLQSEADGDCDDVNDAVFLSSDITDDNCDTVNDNCDTDSILTWDGLVTGVINDGNMDDEGIYGSNDTTMDRVTLAEFEGLPFDGSSSTIDGNLHQPGDQDWFLFDVAPNSGAPVIEVTLVVPDDGTGAPSATWMVGAMSDDTYNGEFADGVDYFGLGVAPSVPPDCDGTLCTMDWVFTSGTNFRDRDSYWAVGVSSWEGTWSSALCVDAATLPSAYRLTVTRP